MELFATTPFEVTVATIIYFVLQVFMYLCFITVAIGTVFLTSFYVYCLRHDRSEKLVRPQPPSYLDIVPETAGKPQHVLG